MEIVLLMKQTDTLYGIFETSSGTDFKNFNQFDDFKCIRYCTSKDQANEIAETLNDYYKWNIFDNIKYMHVKYFDKSIQKAKYIKTVLRRDENRYRQTYHVIELPEITTFSFHSNLTDNSDVCKIIDYYNGDHYLLFIVYFNKVKDATDGKFHIRQYLHITNINRSQKEGLINKYKNGMFKAISLNDIFTKRYIIESSLINDYDDFSNASYTDIDIAKDKKCYDLSKKFYTDYISSDDLSTGINALTKAAIYSVYGYLQLPKVSSNERLDTTHFTVEEKLKTMLKKSEDIVLEKFEKDVFEKNAEDYIFDKVTFEEVKYTAIGGIKWNSQFGYDKIIN